MFRPANHVRCCHNASYHFLWRPLPVSRLHHRVLRTHRTHKSSVLGIAVERWRHPGARTPQASQYVPSYRCCSRHGCGDYFQHSCWESFENQFAEVSRLSAEAAFARAEERALAERLTIARDLHDSLAKSVHGIRMLAETLDSSLASEHHPDAQLSHLIFESADEASREARLVLDGLRSGGDNDAIGALQEEVNRWSVRTGITISTNRSESQPPLPCSTETMWQLQRIVGEILTNIEKHAQATSVNADFFYDNTHFYFDICDDGIGFDNRADNFSQEGHYGLTGLKERTKSLGGHISIDPHSEFGGGTHVSFHAPIDSFGTHKEMSI